MRKKKILLTAALAAVLVAVLAVGSTLAYFTAHTEAKGSAEVKLGYKTEITEEFKDMQKIVTITNNKDSKEPVWVRARAYSAFGLTYEGDGSWTGPDKDGFYTYKDPLAPGESTATPLTVSISAPAADADTEEFNVIVTYECTKVLYDEDGNRLAPDWSLAVKMEGGE